jgi:hypothetical protein
MLTFGTLFVTFALSAYRQHVTYILVCSQHLKTVVPAAASLAGLCCDGCSFSSLRAVGGLICRIGRHAGLGFFGQIRPLRIKIARWTLQ